MAGRFEWFKGASRKNNTETAPTPVVDKAAEVPAHPESVASVRDLIGADDLDAAEEAAGRIDDPAGRARALLEIAGSRPNFSAEELLEKARAGLEAIEDPSRRDFALADFARAEMHTDLSYDAEKTISAIANPKTRLFVLADWHRHYRRTGSRVWSPGDLLEMAEQAANEMGEEGRSASVLFTLAEMALSYRTERATEFASQIAEPVERARAFLRLADGDRYGGRPNSDLVRHASEAVAQIEDVGDRKAIERAVARAESE